MGGAQLAAGSGDAGKSSYSFPAAAPNNVSWKVVRCSSPSSTAFGCGARQEEYFFLLNFVFRGFQLPVCPIGLRGSAPFVERASSGYHLLEDSLCPPDSKHV